MSLSSGSVPPEAPEAELQFWHFSGPRWTSGEQGCK